MNFTADQAESVLATAAKSLATNGGSREVEMLAYGQCKFEESGYDNWNNGQSLFTLNIVLPARLYEQIRASRKLLETNILAMVGEVFERFDSDVITSVHIHQALNDNTDWRGGAQRWLRGEKVSNQGRVRSDKIAPLEKDGLLFRSKPEIELYDALKRRGIPIAPLPVFVQGGSTYQRIEPDLVVINKGVVMVVEVDGDTYHSELPATAYSRLEMLTQHGVEVKRVKAEDCCDAQKAERCAEQIIEYMEKVKAAR